jgi:alpha-N-arabinofuranosidase
MSIPEFILRKLVLPRSLKRTPSGFTFILHNTFAPATITRFQLLNDSEEIPLSQITISEGGKSSITADLCSQDNPLLTPVNIDIGVSVISMKPLGVITIKAVTKEVGPIEFTIEQEKKKGKSRSLPYSWTSAFRAKAKAVVKLNPDKLISDVSPFLLGQFVEHLERCVYDGIWTLDGKRLRPDTMDLIKQLNPPMIRYPGGNFASGYHWEDGIGRKESRPRRHDVAWQAEESNQVGTDEFLSFCEEIGTEPYLVVNDGSGTPEEAAQWVAYCNSPEQTEAGKLRAANGHPLPYHVKYWGVGNEVWGAWQIGTTSAKEYVNRMKRFIVAMKKVDPSIKIIAVGNHPLTDDPDDPAFLWNKEVLERSGELIDFLSWHIYQPEKEGWQESPDEFELFKSICAAPLDIATYLNRVDAQIKAAGYSNKILQALDEWNVWLPPKKGETSMHHVTYTMRDALYVASTLAVLFRNSSLVKIANLAQLVNVLPLIQTNETNAIATTIYYPFILLSQMLGTNVEVEVDSPTFVSKAVGPNISDRTSVSYLDCLATLDQKQKKLSLLLVNRDPFHKMVVDLKGLSPESYKPKESTQIKASHPLAANTFNNPFRVRLSESNLPSERDGAFSIKLDPASICLVEFEIIDITS